jgi:hypothetical protein
MQRAAWLRARPAVRLILLRSFVDDAFIAGAAIQIKRIFNLTDNPIFGKKYRQFPRAVIAGSAPASPRQIAI